MTKIPITLGSNRGEIRIAEREGKFEVAAAAVYRRFLTPFVVLHSFESESGALDYATTLAAAVMNVPLSEITGEHHE